MAEAKSGGWGPKGRSKKTKIGESRNTKFKNRGSAAAPAKDYRKKYRGQGKG